MDNAKKGFFITFEGGEGVGKSTQIPLVKSELEKRGFEVIRLSEPSKETPFGLEVRKCLLTGSVDKILPLTEFFLLMADRYDHVERVVKPALAAGKIVLMDRYQDSSYAYQGYAHDLGFEKLEEIYRATFGDFNSDLTILFDLPEGQSHGRLTEINKAEKLGSDFMGKVMRGYREVAKRYPDRFVVMDSRGSIPEITDRVMGIIENKLGIK